MIDVFVASSTALDIRERGRDAFLQFAMNDDTVLRANLLEIIRNATLLLEFLDTSNE